MKSPHLRFVGVLLALTGVSCIGLIVLGWRSLDRFELEIARVLRQACVNTAEETARQIQRDFKSPVFNLLEQVDHPAIKNFQLDTIAETLHKEGPPHFQVIDTFFMWSLTPPGEPERPLLFYVPPSMPQPAERVRAPEPANALGFFLNPDLAAVMLQQAAEFAPLRKNFAFTYFTYKSHNYHVVYHFLYDEMDRRLLWGFEGFLADPEHLRETYFPQTVTHWNRQGTKSDFPALTFSVLNEDGYEVSRSGRSLLKQYEAEARFPFVFFDTDLFESLSPFRPEVRYWTVRIAYEAGDIDSIVRREGTQQRWAWVLVGLVAIVGTVMTARGTARELRVSRMKSEFVASVSHDLKTPLAKIQLFADTLESGRARTPEKASAYHKVISTQARRLGHLIGELLDFSKIEAGVKQYQFEEIDLSAVLRSSIELFDHELSNEKYVVQVNLPPGEVPVMGNAEALQQVFDNLISNAVKYSPREKYLGIRLGTVNSHAVVEVTDHGIGIPRREHGKIFTKFYRSPGALALAATGSGIGLAIVDHVLRAHRGQISVASAPGQGSTFRVELPLNIEGTDPYFEANFGH
ncbi:MAG TPA: HAMP domain-containing sensor histidine kinase [Vicinamibacterales bacterium]|nr:HAMP domain-containing sensor histidine kinase [Vicinamibacterales bacterium]